MIQLVITDLDKTLLNDEGLISKQNIQSIQLLKDKKISFGIASGRAKHIIQKIAKNFGIYDKVDFIISYNGVSLYEKNKDEDFNGNFLDKEIIKKLYNKFKHRDISFIIHLNNTMICNRVTKYTEKERVINQFEQMVVQDFVSILDRNYPKLMMVGESEVLCKIEEELENYKDNNFSFFKSHENFLEVVSKNVSKAEMLKVLCDKNKINLKNVLSIGDNYNDLGMIKSSGYGVAVGNAVDELKQNAKLVVRSNNEDGFAEAIKYFLKK